MNNRKLRPRVKAIAAAIAAALLIGMVVFAQGRGSGVPAFPTAAAAQSAVTVTERVLQLHQQLKDDEAINSDVVGILDFDSGLITQPVLQGDTNEKYLRTKWEDMSEQSYGSIFMDYRNQLSEDEENTIIYGHYVYEKANADRTLAFTPLRQLRDVSQYSSNRFLSLILDDSVRCYEIVSVYDCPLETLADGSQATVEDLQYNMVEYSDDYFRTYMEAVKQAELYSTGAHLTRDDRILTLQTCIEDDAGSRQIILCRETGRAALD